jgi:hypothetical protein
MDILRRQLERFVSGTASQTREETPISDSSFQALKSGKSNVNNEVLSGLEAIDARWD